MGCKFKRGLLDVGHSSQDEYTGNAQRDPKGPQVSGLGHMDSKGIGSVLPPLSNSWIITIIWLYIALDRTPNIDCYWGEAVPKG